MDDRVLIITPHNKCKVSHRADVLKMFNITNEALDKLLETGEAIMFEDEQVCFDVPFVD